MTKMIVRKTGEVVYLLGIMPNPDGKHRCGKNAIAVCAAEQSKHGIIANEKLPYVIVNFRMHQLDIAEKFDWSDTGDRAENQISDAPGKKGSIPICKKPATEEATSTTTTATKPSGRRSRAMTRMKKEWKRFEASQEFAATKVCCRMVKVASKRPEGNAQKKPT